MLLEHRPETLHQVAQERHRQLMAEANHIRLWRAARRRRAALVDRLAFRLGSALCALGTRLQSRGPLLGK